MTDLSKTPENLNQKDVFADLKNEISDFGSLIEQENAWEHPNQEQFEAQLFDWLKYLTDDVDANDKEKFNKILEKLQDPNQRLDKSDIDKISQILTTLETKNIAATDLEKLSKTVNEMKKTRSSLTSLKQWIKIPAALQEKKEKIESYFNKLKSFKTSHPIWTKALLMMLPASLLPFFKQNENPKTPIASWTLWEIKSFVDTIWNWMQDFLAQIATIFFSWFAPKQMKELLWEIKEFAWNLSDQEINILQTAWTAAGASAVLLWNSEDIISENIPNMEEMKPKLRNYTKQFVKKHFKKDLKDETLDKVIADMNLEDFKTPEDIKQFWQFLAWNLDASWNLLDGVTQTVSMPFKFFRRFASSLEKNWVISWKDVLFSAGKWAVSYAQKPLALFGVGAGAILWKVPFEEFLAEIPKIYEKSPDSAKSVIWILLYRNTWPVFNILGTLWKYATEFLSHIIFDARSLSESFNVYADAFRWKIDSNLKYLKQVQESISHIWMSDAELKMKDEIEILTKAINKFEQNTKYVNAYRELIKEWVDDAKFVEKFKAQFPNFAKEIWNSRRTVRAAIIWSLEWTWYLDKMISEFRAITWASLLWINSASANLNNIGKSLSNTQKTMVRVMQDDSFFWKIRSVTARWTLAMEWIELMRAWDKITYKFKDVSSFKDFTKNLKILAWESPEFVKSIFGKIPIFIVAWIARDSEKSLSSNLKDLSSELLYLTPLFWPFFMLKDWLSFENWNIANLGQAGFGAALFAYDTVHLVASFKTWKILQYAARPFIDMAELVWITTRSGATAFKFTKDFVKILKQAETYKLLRNWLKEMKFWTKFKLAVATMLLSATSYAYAKMPDSEPIPEDLKNELETAIWENGTNEDKSNLDQVLIDNWKDMEIAEQEELIRVYLFMKIGFGNIASKNDIKVEKKENWEFDLSFAWNFWKYIKQNPDALDEIKEDARRFIDFAENWITTI